MANPSTSTRSARWVHRIGAVCALTVGLLVTAACQPVAPAPGATGATPPATAAAAGDIGWEGPSFQGANGSPSGSKPESKVWWNDGKWWAEMWDITTDDFYVYRLDLATQTWVKTSTRLDDRTNARSDVLWDGSKLYVASHAFAEGASSTANAPSYLRRFSYQPATGTYTLDAGFPVQINDAKSETLVIDKDSLGRVWATWTEDRLVKVAVSNVGGSAWGAAFTLPATGTNVSSDDISSVVAYGGNRIGIMWSNESEDTMYFSEHLDSAAVNAWGAAEAAYTGPSFADDHINLKNVADQNGRILAAVKTSRSGSSPLVVLLDRSASGAWSSHVFGTGSDSHTRPIVIVDREHAQVQMFATAGQSGGSIYRKTAPLSNINFPTGKGTAVLTDADSADINNPTSTKQAVDSTTGLVVLATNDSTRRYWTHYDPLGGTTPPPTAPEASFGATPTTGTGPLSVQFTDTSTGSPTSWAWEFGDGGTSTVRNPSHSYAAAGTYTVTLRATNATGTGTVVRTDLITVSPPAPLAPTASFGATPTSGTAPLPVTFTDTSTGTPTSWAWEFGDGGTSTAQNPTHTYTAPGTYSVTLRATNASGTGTLVRTNLISVSAQPPVGQPVTFTVEADAAVKSTSPTKNYGNDKEIRTRAPSPEYRSYLRFNPTGLTGAPSRAILRLYVTDKSKAPSLVWSTATGWGETTITWNNAPPAGTALGSFSPTVAKAWVEFDVTAAVAGNGPVAFLLTSASTDSAIFGSRQSVTAPQLVITPAAPL